MGQTGFTGLKGEKTERCIDDSLVAMAQGSWRRGGGEQGEGRRRHGEE